MKTLILSNYSQKIAELNALTAPNKQAYADRHGYTFENIEWDYSAQVEGLELLLTRSYQFDVVMTVGCDVLFMDLSRPIEKSLLIEVNDYRPIIAREHLTWWPINNDVMIWSSGKLTRSIIRNIIRNADVWITYPWLWQAFIWDWHKQMNFDFLRIVDSREMNSTWREGRSKWQLGDWILHALDAPLEKKIEIIKAYLPFVGNGLYSELPKHITGRK